MCLWLGAASCRRFLEQGFRVDEVGRVETFGELPEDFRQQCVRFAASCLSVPESTEAHGGAELERPRLLVLRDLDGPLEARFGASVRRARSGPVRMGLKRERAFQPSQLA